MQRTQRFHQDLVRILVVGVGGNGSAAVNQLARRQQVGVDLATVHGDADCHAASRVTRRLLLPDVPGHDAGSPAAGRAAARAAQPALRTLLQGADIVVLAAGLGGSTGSGAAPVIARLARDAGAVTLGIVSLPFHFEADVRHAAAQDGLTRLGRIVDALLPLENDVLIDRHGGGALSMAHVADELLGQTVDAISGVVNTPGMINVDFADLRAVLSLGGGAMVATGWGQGVDGGLQAARAAARSRLLDVGAAGARGMIVQISGGPDLSLHAVEQIMGQMRGLAGEDALLVMGTGLDYGLADQLRVTVIATGIGPAATERSGRRPQLRALDGPAADRPVAQPAPPAPPRIVPQESVRRPAWLRATQPLAAT